MFTTKLGRVILFQDLPGYVPITAKQLHYPHTKIFKNSRRLSLVPCINLDKKKVPYISTFFSTSWQKVQCSHCTSRIITNLTVLCRDQSLDFSVNICAAKSLHQMQWSSCHSYAASVSCIQLALTSERRQWCCATAHSQTTNSCQNVEYFPWFTCN